jgi:hypothetical protein
MVVQALVRKGRGVRKRGGGACGEEEEWVVVVGGGYKSMLGFTCIFLPVASPQGN